MPDDLLTTVKAKLAGSAGVLNRWDSEEVAALLARCEAAEARVRQLSEHHAFEVVDPVGGPVAAPCAIEGCRYAELVAERDAARAEAARLRDARADDVALVARLSHQVVALRDAITRVLDGPHYIDRDYQDVLLAALDTPAREGGEHDDL